MLRCLYMYVETERHSIVICWERMSITSCIITRIENMYAYYVSIDPRNDRQKDQTTLIEPVGEVVWECGQDTPYIHETYSVLYVY